MSVAEQVMQKMESLSEEQQREILALAEKLTQTGNCKRPLNDPYGLLATSPSDLTLADFQQARREMWSNFPRESPSEGD